VRTSSGHRSRSGRWLGYAAGLAVVTVLASCSVRGQATPLARTTPTPSASNESPEPGASTTVGQRPPTGFVPATASFVSADTGFAWGVYRCTTDVSTFCPGLAQTHDGGGTWKLRTPPSGTPINPYQRPILRFVDQFNGWAVLDGQIQVTHDGATSWQVVRLDGATRSRIVALEAGPGGVYAVASADPAAEVLRLYRSPNGASAFTAIDGVTLPAAGAAVHLSFAPDGSGYLAADSLLQTTPTFYASTNGLSWQPYQSPCPGGARSAVAAAPAGTVAVVCDVKPTSAGADKHVWTSNTGGASFVPVDGLASTGFTTGAAAAPPPPPTASTPPTASGTNVTYVVTASADEDRIYLSLNSGRSWTVAYGNSADGSGSALGLADLQFADADHGMVILGNAGVYAKDRLSGSFAVLLPRLLLTGDGGKHWAQSVIH